MEDLQAAFISTLVIMCAFIIVGIVIGLIFHYSFIKERKKLIQEAKEKYPELFESRVDDEKSKE